MSRPDTVEVPAMRVVGFSIRTSHQAQIEAAPGEGPIAQAWRTFNGRELEKKIPNPHVSGEVVAVYHDYEQGGSGEYTLTIGLRVTALHHVPKDLDGVEVPFQTYARYTFTGTPDEIATTIVPDAWTEINADASLPRAYTYDLEVYQPESTPDTMRAEILVALTGSASS
jgi:predicted transcriptional regulator YdeE